MEICVHFVQSDSKWTFKAEKEMTIGQIKQQIYAHIQKSNTKCDFFYQQQLLNEDEKTLENLSILNGSIIECREITIAGSKEQKEETKVQNSKQKNNNEINNSVVQENFESDDNDECNDPPDFQQHVEFLTNMGFQENQVIYVLRHNNYDISECIDLLQVDTKDPSIRRYKDESEEDNNEDSNNKSEDDLSQIWTEEDDELMFRKFIKYGNNWKVIQIYFPHKSMENCRQHWINVVKPAIIGEQPGESSAFGPMAARRKWSEADDEVLFAMWQVFGCDWERISNHIPGKSADMIREHWARDLQPHLLEEKRLTEDMIRKRNSFENFTQITPRSQNNENNEFQKDIDLVNSLKNEWTREEMLKLQDFVIDKKNINVIIRAFSDRHSEDDVKCEISKIEEQEKLIEEQKRKEIQEGKINPFAVRYFPPLEVIKSEKKAQSTPLSRIVKHVKHLEEKLNDKRRKEKTEDKDENEKPEKKKRHRHINEEEKEQNKKNEQEKSSEKTKPVKVKEEEKKQEPKPEKQETESKELKGKRKTKRRRRRTRAEINEAIKQKIATASPFKQRASTPALEDIKPWTEDENILLKDLIRQYNKKWAIIRMPFEGSHSLEDIMNHWKILEHRDNELKKIAEENEKKAQETVEYSNSEQTNEETSEKSSSESDSDSSDSSSETSSETSSSDSDSSDSLPQKPEPAHGKKPARWSEKEDIHMLKMLKKYGTNWDKVQRKIVYRTTKAIQSHWYNDLILKLSESDENELREKFPKLFPASKQMPKKYHSESKTEFTKEEDDYIVQKAMEIGPDWKEIAKKFKLKSTSQIYARWHSFLQYHISDEQFKKIYPNKDRNKIETSSESQSSESDSESSSSESESTTESSDSSSEQSETSDSESSSNQKSLNIRFTQKEDKKMIKVLTKKGFDWLKLHHALNNRPLFTIFRHWETVLKPRLSSADLKSIKAAQKEPPPKGEWTQYEERLLWILIKEQGYKWEEFHNNFIPYKTGNQLKEYFENTLEPKLNDTQKEKIMRFGKSTRTGKKLWWSPAEDKFLIQKVKELNQNWSKIYKFFPDRTESSIQNHWAVIRRNNPHLRSIRSEGLMMWTQKEDKLLLKLKLQQLSMVEIQKKFPGRSKQSICSRWLRIKLRPDIAEELKKHAYKNEKSGSQQISQSSDYSTYEEDDSQDSSSKESNDSSE